MNNASSDEGCRPNAIPGLDNADLRRMITQELPHSAVFVVDHDLRYALAEGAELRTAGLAPLHFVGKTVREMVPQDQVAQAEEDYGQVLKGSTFSREHVVNQRHYHSYGMPLLDSDGNAGLALVVSYDVTERVRGERRLRLLYDVGVLAQSDIEPATLLDDISSLMRSHAGAVDCLMADVVPETMQIADLSSFVQRHHLPHQLPLEVLGDECVSHLLLGRVVVQPAIQPGTPPCAIFETLGIPAYVLVPHLSDGRLAGLFAACRSSTRGFQPDDIGTIKVIAASAWSALERYRAMQSLLDAERHKTKIFALLGHELRSPLSVLSGGISLLKQIVGDERAIKTLSLMERQAKQLTRTIEDLLGASYVNFGKLELHIEDVSLHDIVDNVIQASTPAATRKKQQLVKNPVAGPVMVRADYNKLMQVVTNLVSNAIKYTPEGGHIEATLSECDDDALFILSDNGIGIEQQLLPHMFEPFVRGSDGRQASTTDQTGLGIGLWVVKQFVDAHGGRVSVASTGPGKGSTFEVRLPKSGPSTST